MSELSHGMAIQYDGKEIPVERLSSDELRYYGLRYGIPLLLNIADEKAIIEGAEDMLWQISESEGGF